jgi:hypothetical protein
VVEAGQELPAAAGYRQLQLGRLGGEQGGGGQTPGAGGGWWW